MGSFSDVRLVAVAHVPSILFSLSFSLCFRYAFAPCISFASHCRGLQALKRCPVVLRARDWIILYLQNLLFIKRTAFRRATAPSHKTCRGLGESGRPRSVIHPLGPEDGLERSIRLKRLLALTTRRRGPSEAASERVCGIIHCATRPEERRAIQHPASGIQP